MYLQGCADAAKDWRNSLEDLNDSLAGLAPVLLELTVDEGNFWNWLIGLWGTSERMVLANGDELPMNLQIGRNGRVISADIKGAADINDAGCDGALAVFVEGQLTVDGTSWLKNHYGGLLTCGVVVEGLGWVGVVASLETKNSVSEV